MSELRSFSFPRPPVRLRPAAARRLAVGAGILLAGVALAAQVWPVHSAALGHPVTTLLCVLGGLLIAWRPGGWFRLKGLFLWSDRLFYSVIFAVAALVHLFVAWHVFGAAPRLDDGVGALFQARIFARGQLVLPLPPEAGFYEVFGVLGNRAQLGHWCGMYPPGWPALLTPGVWVGAPWIINPLLGAGLVVLIGRIGSERFGRLTGRVASLLAMGSPFVIVLSALHLSHVPTTFFCCACFLLIRHLIRTGRWYFGLFAGLCWGVAYLCRPLTALVIGVVFGLYILSFPNRWRRYGPAIGWGLLAAMGAAVLYMAFLQATTGHPLLPGHVLGMGERWARFGFGPYGRIGREHTLLGGGIHTLWRLRAVNDHLLGWLIPALPLTALPLLMGRRRREDFLLWLPFLLLLGTFACYWYYEEYFPARYTSCGLPFLLILAARGLVLAWRRLRSHPRAILRRLVPSVAAVNLLFLLVVSTPAHFSRYDSRFADVEGILPQVVKTYGLTHSVIAMDSINTAGPSIVGNPVNDYYATGFMRNDLDLTNDVIFVRNSRRHNTKLLELYPGRTLYLYRYCRDLDRAQLYRMIPDGDALRLKPFPADGRLLVEAPPVDPITP